MWLTAPLGALVLGVAPIGATHHSRPRSRPLASASLAVRRAVGMATRVAAAPFSLALGTVPTHVGDRGDASFTSSIVPLAWRALPSWRAAPRRRPRCSRHPEGDVEKLRRSLAARAPAAPLPLALGTLPVHAAIMATHRHALDRASRGARFSSWRRLQPAALYGARVLPGGLPPTAQARPENPPAAKLGFSPDNPDVSHLARATASGSVRAPLTILNFPDGSGGTGRQAARMNNPHGYSFSGGLDGLDGRILI
jgi:hypothetical protein